MASFVLLAAPALRAQFLDPRNLSSGGGAGGAGVIQATAGVDLSANAYVAWTAGQELFLDIIGVQTSHQITLSDPRVGCGDPGIATNTVGLTYIVFTQDDPIYGGRDVFLVSNPGGVFARPPRNVSRNPGDDYAPKLYLDNLGQAHLVWAQRPGNKSNVVYLPPEGTPTPLAAGDYPSLAIDSRGTALIVFTRGRDLYLVHNRGGAFKEFAVTRTPFDDEFFPSIAVAASGNVFVAYERGGGLYYHESLNGGDSFGPPRLIDNGGVTTPELRVTPDPEGGDILSIAYEKSGELYYVLGRVGERLLSPVRVRETPEDIESHPSLAVDARGYVHVSFIKKGEVYYTNNTGQLSAEFSSQVIQGEVPLEVKFTDLSSGLIETWSWDFGDGSPRSNARHPVHVYEEPDKYTVTLEVFGTGTSAKIEKKDYIFVQSPNNRLWIPNQTVLPGQQGIWYPIMCYHRDPLQGFQLVGTFDPNILTLRDVTYEQTALDGLETEFFKPFISNEPSDAMFYAGVIFDFDMPYRGQTLPATPPETAQRIVHLIFDCVDDAPQGATTVVEPKNGMGPNNLHNAFAVQGITYSVLPVITGSVTTIQDGFPPPQIFRRGDGDWSGSVDLSDAVAALQYLFLGGTVPRCMDAVDVDDNGRIDIADPIGILGYLFLGRTPPAVPFPNLGLDPNEDDLPTCKR